MIQSGNPAMYALGVLILRLQTQHGMTIKATNDATGLVLKLPAGTYYTIPEGSGGGCTFHYSESGMPADAPNQDVETVLGQCIPVN